MDLSFDVAEQMNRKMAVAYSKNLETENAVADNQINNQFTQAVAAPLFSKMLTVEATDADASMDNMIADDAQIKVDASAFRKAVIAGNIAADEQLDLMVYASTVNNKKLNTTDADTQMDALLNKSSFSPVRPSVGGAADQAIDALLKKMN
jgi:hypothetical protein